MSFQKIIGQKPIIQSLTNAINSEKIGHAYLFVGAEGIGKRTLARAFIKELLCEKKAMIDCSCRACRLMATNNHPDLIEVNPVGNSIKIEQLRELQKNAYFHPIYGKHKIFFFPEGEALTLAAANSLLKILEEPPPAVIFVFVATRLESLLPTIRSRCQVMHLFPVGIQELTDFLSKKGLSEAEIEKKIKESQGNLKKALAEEEAPQEELVSFPDFFSLDLLALLVKVNELEKKERNVILDLLQQIEIEARAELVNCIHKDVLNAKINVQQLVLFLEKIPDTINAIKSNCSQRLALETLIVSTKLLIDEGI